MKHQLRIATIAARNMILFIVAVLKRGILPHLWPSAWRGIQADHLALIRKEIWELKKAGEIYEDSEGRLWSSKPKS